MSSRPFMQLYISDYLGDTQDLTCEQHGAYLLLLMAMWQRGGELPNDPKKLARICHLTLRAFKRIRPDVLPFFDVDDGRISHRRMTKELEKFDLKTEKRRTAGSRGGTATALKNKETTPANAAALLQHSPETRDQRPETINSHTLCVDAGACVDVDVDEGVSSPTTRSSQRKLGPSLQSSETGSQIKSGMSGDWGEDEEDLKSPASPHPVTQAEPVGHKGPPDEAPMLPATVPPPAHPSESWDPVEHRSLDHKIPTCAGMSGGVDEGEVTSPTLSPTPPPTPAHKQDLPKPAPKAARKSPVKSRLPGRCYAAWNALAATYGLSLVSEQGLNFERDKRVLSRLSDCADREDVLLAAIQNTALNPHWLGQSPSGWRADFDWLFESASRLFKSYEFRPAPQNESVLYDPTQPASQNHIRQTGAGHVARAASGRPPTGDQSYQSGLDGAAEAAILQVQRRKAEDAIFGG